MERERLNLLMQDPSRAGKEDLAGLQELSARYPWFSAAHLLLAVGEHVTGDVLYDERARTAAAHLPDRAVLFDLVHTEAVPPAAPPADAPAWATTPVVQMPEVHAPAAPLPTEPVMDVAPPAPIAAPPEHPTPPAPAPAPIAPVEVAAPVAEVPVIPIPVPPPAMPEAVSTTQPAPPGPTATAPTAPVVHAEPPVPPATTVTSTAAPEAPPATPVEPAPEPDPLDQLIRGAVYAGTYELLLEHEQALKPAPAPTPAPPPAPPAKRRFTDWLGPAEPVAAVPVPPSGPAVSDWIRQAPEPTAARADASVEDTPAAPVPAPGPAPAPAAGAAPASRVAAPSEGAASHTAAPSEGAASPAEAKGAGMASPEAPAKPKAGMSVSEAASLIDRFIRQETPDPPKRAAFFHPQTAAKRSLEEHAELVTETLAQIYAKQGNTAKAKAAYRKLAERHPERREHFLALAKALDNPPKP